MVNKPIQPHFEPATDRVSDRKITDRVVSRQPFPLDTRKTGRKRRTNHHYSDATSGTIVKATAEQPTGIEPPTRAVIYQSTSDRSDSTFTKLPTEIVDQDAAQEVKHSPVPPTNADDETADEGPNDDEADTDEADTDEADTDEADTDEADTDEADTDEVNTDEVNETNADEGMPKTT